MNVLVFLTDQQQRGSLGCYGNQIAITPNIDQLASSGTVFEGGVCAQPVCGPSRCSLLSGVFPHAHGVYDNYHPLPRRFPTIAEMVIDHGVRPGYIGKWHLGNEVLPQRGFEQFFHAVDDDYTNNKDFPLYGPCGYSQWLIDKGHEPNWQERPGRFTREFTSRLPEEDSKPAFISEQACGFIETRQDESFFLVCSFLEPHNPYHSHYDDLHDRAKIDLPPNFHTDVLDDWPQRNAIFQRWAREVPHADEPAFDNEEHWKDVIARYLGACHLVDRHVGIVMDRLKALGIDDDTLVIYTSDHGDMMGGHAMYLKSMMYEESQGVPLIVRDPRCNQARRITEPVNLVDIAPTVLDTFDVEAPSHLHGESLLPLINGTRAEQPDKATICEWNGVIQNMFAKHEMFAPVKDMWIRSMRTSRWKLNINRGDMSELYDLQDDPGEMNNRINDASYNAVIDSLCEQLRAWQKKTDDVIEMPDPRESANIPVTLAT